MQTIQIKIDYQGEVTLNDEHKTKAPLEMTWFPGTDLIIETEFERIVVNSEENITVTPKVADRNLEIVKDVKLQLAKNNLAAYVIINEKYIHQLPSKIFDIV